MQIILNGERTAVEARDLAELCQVLGFADAKIATAVNGNFVPAAERALCRLGESDEVEIVAPRQGG